MKGALRPPFASIFTGQQDGQDAGGDIRVCRVVAAIFQPVIVIVDLPEDFFASIGEAAKIMLAIGVIISGEIVVVFDYRAYFRDLQGRVGHDALRHVAFIISGAVSQCLAKLVIELGDTL